MSTILIFLFDAFRLFSVLYRHFRSARYDSLTIMPISYIFFLFLLACTSMCSSTVKLWRTHVIAAIILICNCETMRHNHNSLIQRIALIYTEWPRKPRQLIWYYIVEKNLFYISHIHMNRFTKKEHSRWLIKILIPARIWTEMIGCEDDCLDNRSAVSSCYIISRSHWSDLILMTSISLSMCMNCNGRTRRWEITMWQATADDKKFLANASSYNSHRLILVEYSITWIT